MAGGLVVRCDDRATRDPARSRGSVRSAGPASTGGPARLPRHRDDRARDGHRDGRLPHRPRLVGGRRLPPGPAAAPRPCRRTGAPHRLGRLHPARRLARDLQRPRLRLAAARHSLPHGPPGRADPRRPPRPAAGRPAPLPPPARRRAAADGRDRVCSGWSATATSTGRRSPGATSVSCAAGRPSRSPRSSATTTRTSARSRACWSCSPAATGPRKRDGPRRPATSAAWPARSLGRGRLSEALECYDVAFEAEPAPAAGCHSPADPAAAARRATPARTRRRGPVVVAARPGRTSAARPGSTSGPRRRSVRRPSRLPGRPTGSPSSAPTCCAACGAGTTRRMPGRAWRPVRAGPPSSPRSSSPSSASTACATRSGRCARPATASPSPSGGNVSAVRSHDWRPTCAPARDGCDDVSSGGPRPQPGGPTRGRRGSGSCPDQRDRTWSSAGSNEQAIVRRSPASALR